MQEPYCHYHKERHKPTHCRECGRELPNTRLWYCGGAWGDCGKRFWSLNNWADARDLALKKAGYKCQECGEDHSYVNNGEVKYLGGLGVHHIEPVKGTGRYGESNRASNLIALCHKCHGIKHRKAESTLKIRENEDRFEVAHRVGQGILME